MPRTNEQNQKIKEERSNDIFAAALKLFSVVGYNNVSVDLITQTVDCSHGLFYHYYSNVDDIFKKLLKESDKFDFEPFNIKEVVEAEGFEPLKKIASYFSSENVTNDAFLCYAKIILSEESTKPLCEYLNRRYKFKNVTEALTSVVSKGQESGDVINGDPAQIASAIKMFLLSYVATLSSQKPKDRKPLDYKVLLGFVSKKAVK